MVYLGAYGTADSKRAYKAALAEWLANDRVRAASTPQDAEAMTVSEVIAAYWRHAEAKYGSRSSARSRLSLIKRACKPLRNLYGSTPAASFGPLKLRAVRQTFIDAGFSRKYVTDLNGVTVRMFKWAASMELIPATVYQALTTVGGLERGEAKKTKPIKHAPLEYVAVVKRAVSKQIRAMMDLQLLTGMRPGEAVIMRPCAIETGGRLWTYRPERHKTEHHGIERVIVLGPKAQAVIKPFLAGRATDAYLFSPKEADADRRAELTAKRTTPASCGNIVGVNRKRRPRRRPGQRYTTATYARAIKRTCESLDIPAWTPNQLRHTAATQIRKEFGAEAARIMLGHQHLKVTEIYAERDFEVANRIAAKVG